MLYYDVHFMIKRKRWGGKMSDILIRDVRPEDAERLVEIYAYYILDTAVSFEYEVPSISEFTNRIEKISRKYPYLVCEIDGKVVGYVYAGTYSGRTAYNWTVTTSIYLDKEYRRRGIGTMLYKELEERLKKQGIINLLAGVAYCEEEDEYLTHDSIKFHTEQGYKKVAHMETVGKKFDRWYDLIWMQKKIGEI